MGELNFASSSDVKHKEDLEYAVSCQRSSHGTEASKAVSAIMDKLVKKFKKKNRKKGKKVSLMSGSGVEGCVTNITSAKCKLFVEETECGYGDNIEHGESIATAQCKLSVEQTAQCATQHDESTQNLVLAVVESVCTHEPSALCLEDSHDEKLIPRHVCGENSDFSESHVPSYTCNNKHSDTSFSGGDLKGIVQVVGFNAIEKNMISSKDGTKYKPRYHYNTASGKENGPYTCQNNSRNAWNSCIQGDNKLNHAHARKDGVKPAVDNLLIFHDSLSSNGLLPVPVVLSSEKNTVAQDAEDASKNNPRMYGKTTRNVLAESSHWAVQQKGQFGLHQFDSGSGQNESVKSTGWGRSKEKQNQSCRHEPVNMSKSRLEGNNANIFRNRGFLLQKEAGELHHIISKYAAHRGTENDECTGINESACVHSYRTSSHIWKNMSHAAISTASDPLVFPGVELNTFNNISCLEHLFGGSAGTSMDDKHKYSYFDVKLSHEDSIRKDYNSRVLQKWIPFGRKDSEMVKNFEVIHDYNNLKCIPNSCEGKVESHLKVNMIPFNGSVVSIDQMSNLDKPREGTTESVTTELANFHKNVNENCEREHRDNSSPGNKEYEAIELYICSEMALKSLSTSYRLQIAAESVQLATGSPLAEFEKLIHSATPVIAHAYVPQYCSVCLGNRLSYGSLCEHQRANIPLTAFWSWYEKPGNYGLEVKAEDFQCLNGADIDCTSFNAHFVPFLSAVQLFGHSQYSGCCNNKSSSNYSVVNTQNRENDKWSSLKILKSGITCTVVGEPNHLQAEEICSSKRCNLVEPPAILSEIFPPEENDSLALSSCCSFFDDLEVIFEFFENEPPQLRKSLYDKVMELMISGTSNHQVYGDPLRLNYMSLGELHPASWYSVAWYPIYRIPEGNFRASFLTYHSLGHLVQRFSRDSVKESQYAVVSPVLGLQSYNTQKECWFNPKRPVNSYSEEFPPFNCCEILKERLRTLEETASLFARGLVFKDHVKVTNCQPDYEFFLSRKN